MEEVPYEELDAQVVALVRCLNEMPGVSTLGSCAGHEEPLSGGAWPADSWYVTFRLESASPDPVIAVPTEEAWVSLEFLVWAINTNLVRAEKQIDLRAVAPPPYLNDTGAVLRFAIEGGRVGAGGIEPDELAAEIESHIEAGRFLTLEDIVAEADDLLDSGDC